MLTDPIWQVIHQSSLSLLLHEQFGTWRLFLHIWHSDSEVHSSHGHF